MGWQAGILSDEMAIELLYRDSIGKKTKEKEIKFIQDQKKQNESMGSGAEAVPGMGLDEEELGELGKELGGNNNNDYNLEHAKGDAINKVAGEL